MSATLSLAERLRGAPEGAREAILASCSAREIAALRWCWREFWARPDERDPTDPRIGRGQLAPPPPWTWWCSIGGRGSGKTEACARWVTEQALEQGKGAIFTLVGPSLDGPNGVRAVMIEGPSGLAQACPPWGGFDFRSSVHTVTWRSGAIANVFGADKPSTGRGPQCNGMWIDDPAAFGPAGKPMIDQLMWGFRLRWPDGSDPRGVVSSTPIDSELLDFFLDGAEVGKRKSAIVYSFSTTDDNRAHLAESFYQQTIAEFAGTEQEAQERYGQRVKAHSGKVFGGIALNVPPVRVGSLPSDLVAIAIWIDPSTSTAAYSCEVGIVVTALDVRGHVYGVEDLSGVMNASEWPDVAVDAAERWALIAPTHIGVEVNAGGNMGPALIEQAERIRRMQRGLPGVATIECRIAKTQRSKAQRASPLPRLAKAGQLHLLPGLDQLERQLRELDDREATKLDRADAYVHGVLDLALGAYVVGGAPMTFTPGARLGPAPLGSMNVGPAPSFGPGAPGQPFAFGVPSMPVAPTQGGWR